MTRRDFTGWKEAVETVKAIYDTDMFEPLTSEQVQEAHTALVGIGLHIDRLAAHIVRGTCHEIRRQRELRLEQEAKT